MDTKQIVKLKGQFDALTCEVPGEDVEFWYARDLQVALGYTKWERFSRVIARANESCSNTGIAVEDHFADVSKMVGSLSVGAAA